MKIRISSSDIYPSPEINDCPIEFLPTTEPTVQYEGDFGVITAHATNGFNPKWYSFGPIACSFCKYNCQDARVSVDLDTMVHSGGFRIDESPVSVGKRTQPRGRSESHKDESPNAQPLRPTEQTAESFLTTADRQMDQAANDILDDLSTLADPDLTIDISSDGRIRLSNPSPENEG